MAAVLIAVVLALLLGHTAPQLARLRDFTWFAHWLDWLDRQHAALHRQPAGVLLSIGLPVAALALVQYLLDDRLYGLSEFALAVLALFYCWGPRDLDRDVDAIVDAPDSESRRLAAANLLPAQAAPTLEAPRLVEAVFRSALVRWFGVLFWFLVLGPAGALLYRLTQLAAGHLSEHLPTAHAAAAQRLAAILDWPVAQLMTLAAALAANFDTVFGAWRDWHAARGQGYLVLDTGFVDAVARASVDFDLAQDDVVGVESAGSALLELRDAMSLIWRMLIVWLLVLALFVLAGWVG